MLSLFGGERLPDESPIECAARELREETGIDDVELAFLLRVAYPIGSEGDFRGGDLFVAILPNASKIRLTEGAGYVVADPKDVLEFDKVTRHARMAVERYISGRR
jgi:8-oxo-dGTP pyrophosphatase MutT (NUDIX family)